jgi:exodeoxyribonuclease VII small subunit
MTQENSHKTGARLDDLSFEQALSRLDETVQLLEKGGLTLSESTSLFEQGMKLARICNEMLVSAELQITRIQTAYGEQMRMLEEAESYDMDEEG